MTSIEDGFGFYGLLTGPAVDFPTLALEMVRRRVRFIQLRMKDSRCSDVCCVARELRRIITPPSLLIINDDPYIAREIRADGVHLGQKDLSFTEAREIVGADAIIGLSTHNVEQLRAACALDPTYIGVGPVFPTKTKTKPDPTIGLNGLRALLSNATVPAVAIGGIDLDNVGLVLASGARNVCPGRCINEATHPRAALDGMIKALSR